MSASEIKRKVWNRLVYLGVKPEMEANEAQRIRVVNITALVIMSICGLLVFSTAFSERWIPCFIQLFRVVTCGLTLWLNSKHKKQWALLVFYCFFLLSIIFFSLFVPEFTGNPLSFFVMFIFIFYLVESEQKAALLFWVSAILFVVVYYYELNYKESFYSHVHLVAPIVIAVTIYFVLRLYRSDQRRVEHQLKKSNATVLEQKEILLQKGEEILQQNEELVKQTEYLESLNAKLERTQATLQDALFLEQERKQAVEIAHRELKEAQDHLVTAEKMAALGQVVANVAHELNTPLAAIQSNVGSIEQRIVFLSASLPRVYHGMSTEIQQLLNQFVAEGNEKNVSLTTLEQRKERKKLEQLFQHHELSDWKIIARRLVKLGFTEETIQTYLPLVSHENGKEVMDVATQMADLIRSVDIINLAVGRANKVIHALQSYSHQRPTAERSEYDIVQGIEMALVIYQNQMKRGIQLTKSYADSPTIMAYPDELSQVWTNLIHNAIQAMNQTGNLHIETKNLPTEIQISFSDTGKGIPPEIQEKVFTPFFTTKEIGEGSGLGLNIVQRIIEKHQGRISLESEVGKGATFHVFLPK